MGGFESVAACVSVGVSVGVGVGTGEPQMLAAPPALHTATLTSVPMTRFMSAASTAGIAST